MGEYQSECFGGWRGVREVCTTTAYQGPKHIFDGRAYAYGMTLPHVRHKHRQRAGAGGGSVFFLFLCGFFFFRHGFLVTFSLKLSWRLLLARDRPSIYVNGITYGISITCQEYPFGN